MGEWVNGCVDGWTNGQTDRWVAVYMYGGWLDGQIDGYIDKYLDRQTLSLNSDSLALKQLGF